MFGVIRSATVDKMPGGISAFYAKILDMCFLSGSHTMQHGAQLVCNGESFHVNFKYGGLLADEDCLKKVHNYKGAQGIKPCMNCGNLLKVKNRAFLPASLTHIDAATLADIDFNKNEDI